MRRVHQDHPGDVSWISTAIQPHKEATERVSSQDVGPRLRGRLGAAYEVPSQSARPTADWGPARSNRTRLGRTSRRVLSWRPPAAHDSTPGHCLPRHLQHDDRRARAGAPEVESMTANVYELAGSGVFLKVATILQILVARSNNERHRRNHDKGAHPITNPSSDGTRPVTHHLRSAEGDSTVACLTQAWNKRHSGQTRGAKIWSRLGCDASRCAADEGCIGRSGAPEPRDGAPWSFLEWRHGWQEMAVRHPDLPLRAESSRQVR